MDNEIIIMLPIEPPTATHQQKKVNWNQRRFYEPQNVKEARQLLRGYLSHYAPARPLEGAVGLTVTYLYGTKDKRRDGEYKTTRPDLDNSQKLLQDVMTDLGFWADDARIVDLRITKFWSIKPGIAIKVEQR